MQYTVEQANTINHWIERCVSLVLTNDEGACAAIRENLIENYDPGDGWDFRGPFVDWLRLEQLDIQSAPVMLLIDLLDLGDQDVNDALVALFLDEDERAAVERDHGDVVDHFAMHRAEPEYTVKIPAIAEVDTVVEVGISVAGGGTVGETYADNEWIYSVWCDGELVISGGGLRSSADGATHHQMVGSLARFLASDAETIRNYGALSTDSADELSGDYTYTGREFLETHGERFSVWEFEENGD